MRRLFTLLACGGLLFALMGCNATTCPIGLCEPTVATPVVAEGPPTTATVQEPLDVKYYRSDEPLRMGIEHFNRGNFGIAGRYFRDATEKAPKDPTAWIGLAAS